MNEDFDRGPTVDENVGRWRNRVGRRMRASDERRPIWDRQQFLTEFWDDHPGDPRAVEFADKFEAAIAEAHGNPKRFELELDRLMAA
jgi:hypothetical protein